MNSRSVSLRSISKTSETEIKILERKASQDSSEEIKITEVAQSVS
jgi:hypothetical protein